MTGVCIEASALDGTCVGTFAECEASINARITSGELERDVLAEQTRLEGEVMLDRGASPRASGLCAASPATGTGSGFGWLFLAAILLRRTRRSKSMTEELG